MFLNIIKSNTLIASSEIWAITVETIINNKYMDTMANLYDIW